MKEFALLMDFTETSLWLGYVVFLRVGAAVAVMPGFGERSVPPQLKIMIGIAITTIIAPSVGDIGPPDMSRLMMLSLTEPAIGLLIGMSLRLFLLAIQTTGAIAAQSTSLAQISAGAFPDPMPAIGQLLTMAAVAMFFLLELHVEAVLLILQSYALFPIGLLPDPAQTAEWGTGAVTQAFALAFRLAAPFFLLSLIYNITLGAINRAMPQLMVIFVGAPVITWGSLAVLLLVCSAIMEIWSGEVIEFLSFPFGGGP